MNVPNVVPITANTPPTTPARFTETLLSDPAFRLQSMAACLEALGSDLLTHADGDIVDLKVVEIKNGPDPYLGFELTTIERGVPQTKSIAVVQINRCNDPVPFFLKWVKESCTPRATTIVFSLLHNAG